MKILIYSDNHFSEYSSIFRSKNQALGFSNRLINQIDCINWVERIAIENDCEIIICAGDFFDKPDLTSVELTALKEINWSNINHYFIVGNHELGRHDLFYNSVNALNAPNTHIIDDIISVELNDFTSLCFVPYQLNTNNVPLSKLLINMPKKEKRIVISHNDIAGIQLGQFISKDGFDISDIQSCCNLFINGHIHNGAKLAEGVYNIGNLTGQNFSEDGFKFKHNVILLDTNTLNVEFIDNPYAVYFYKIDVASNLQSMYTIFDTISANSVLTIRCDYSDVSTVRDYIESLICNGKNIYDYRIISVNNNTELKIDMAMSIESIDHIQKFKASFIEKYGSNDIILSELQEVSL